MVVYRELEKQKEDSASEIARRKQEAEAAVSKINTYINNNDYLPHANTNNHLSGQICCFLVLLCLWFSGFADARVSEENY